VSSRDQMAEPSKYVPPKQSRGGQLFDSLFILALLFVVLFGVTYYSNATAAESADEVRPLSELPITQVEREQYQKVIDEGLTDLEGVNDQVAASDPKPGSEQYPIGALALLLTVVVIGGYLSFVYLMSFREYREVIRERFGPGPDRPSTAAAGDRT
jgi:hypothetical protein